MGDSLRAIKMHWGIIKKDDIPNLPDATADLWVGLLENSVCSNRDAFIDSITDPFNHPQITIVGIESVSVYEQADKTWIESDLYDYDLLINHGVPTIGAPLKRNSCYLAGISAPEVIFLLDSVSNGGFSPSNSFFLINDSVRAVYQLDQFAPFIRLELNTSADTTVSATVPTLSEESVELYPNPVLDRLTLDFDLERPQDISIRITDVMGRTVSTKQLESIHRDRWTTGWERSMKGLFFIQIAAEEGNLVLRFVSP